MVGAAHCVRADFTRVPAYYNVASPYLVTNVGVSRLIYIATALVGAPSSGIEYLPISGETVMGEEYVEFHADKTSLYEAVLGAFYTTIDAVRQEE